jgi:uncharacterized protein (DUF302 family)
MTSMGTNMMKFVRASFSLLALALGLSSAAALAERAVVGGPEWISLRSAYSVEKTADRLRSAIASRGLGLVAEVDHAGAAQKAGLELPPTRLFLFGNPKVGTQLMQEDPRVGIELPMKILIWQDASKVVWIGRKDMGALASTYDLKGKAPLLGKMNEALDALAKESAGTL